MSNFSDFFFKKNYRSEVEIGKPTIILGSNANPANTVNPGQSLNQATSPELFSKIGQIKNEYWRRMASNTGSSQLWTSLYVNDIYLVAGTSGVISTSTDAITWIARTSNTTSQISKSTYGNNLYLVAGAGGVLRSSTDTITWENVTSGTSTAIRSLAYANNLFVYGTTGDIKTSTDAITWTSVTNFSNGWLGGTIFDMKYINDKFYFVGDNALVGSSTNGIEWNYFPRRISFTPSFTPFGVNYGQGLYIAVGSTGVIRSSANAITWDVQTSGTTTNLWNINYDNSRFYAYGDSGVLLTSENGINWTTRTTGTTAQIRTKTYIAGESYPHLIAGTSGVLRASTDGITWETRTSGTTSEITSILYGNNLYVMAGAGGMLRTSTNGITWDTRTSGTSSRLNKLFYDNALYFYVGDSGVLRTSTDAITWDTRTSRTTSAIFNIVYFNGRYVYNGASTFGTSTDGITWEPYDFNNRSSYSWYNSYVNANTFVVPTNSGFLFVSKDLFLGANATTSLQFVKEVNGTIYTGGSSGVLRKTQDFYNWTIITSNTTATIYDITYGNDMYLHVSESTLFSSTDSNYWIRRRSFGGDSSYNYRTVNYSNNLFIATGATSNVVTSTDINILQGTSLVSSDVTQFYVPNIVTAVNTASINYTETYGTKTNFRVVIKTK